MLKRLVADYASRLHHMRESLKKKGIDGFLVNDITNVRYLSGFTGSSGFLIITGKENFFATDFRYRDQAEKEVSGWDIVIERDRLKTIQGILKKAGIKCLGFESSMTYAFFSRLLHAGLRVLAFDDLIEKFREIKDDAEINMIKEAVRRAESAFLEIKPYIRKGISEKAIAIRLEERLKKKGCRRIPFDIIVAAGSNSAMPHAKPTERKLQKGDIVIIDWGGEADGYYSDMTRTFLMKGDQNISKKKEIYEIVSEANRKAISKVLSGVRSRVIDGAARNFIRKAGYSEMFGHGTGHGVGLQVHEAPRISLTVNEIVRENMVFTIEPGIYIPVLGGVRIEDMVLVKDKGAEVLTSLPEKLEII